MTLPAYAVDFRGKPACPCQVFWLTAYEAEAQRRGILSGPLSIAQLIGGAPQSGGTHSSGGASDFWPNGDVEQMVWLARAMGADATWHRPRNWDGRGGSEHIHSVLTGCPHNGPARYQIDAVRAGLNGLANHGKDTGPRPLSNRSWREGITWAEEQDMTPQQAAQLDGLTKAVASLADMVEALAEGNDAIKKRITKAKREVIDAVEDSGGEQ